MQKPRKFKPWNKGRKVGKKPALKPEEVQAIKVVLAQSFPLRDQLMFAVGIDGCLRGCDLVRLDVNDVCLAGTPRDVVRVVPTKTADTTGIEIAFELQPETKKLLTAHIEAEGLGVVDPLFSSLKRKRPLKGLSETAYGALVKKWVASISLNPTIYGTHSVRRSRPAFVYRQTLNLRACQLMLGHASITVTQEYLGVEEEETLALARQFQM